jgi:hypothetical protein
MWLAATIQGFKLDICKTKQIKITRILFFYLLKGPAADATDAPQPWRLIVQPCDEDEDDDDDVFSAFSFNGAPVKWNWQGGKPKYSEKNLSQYHFVHHKSHMDRTGIEAGPPR